MKKLLDSVPKRVDAAFARHALSLEKSAGRLRWFFCGGFALVGLWLLARGEAGGVASLVFAAMWLASALFVRTRARRAVESDGPALAGLAVTLDVLVACVGLVLCLWQGMFAPNGIVLFACFFPVLALSARYFNALLVVGAAAFISLFYLVLIAASGALSLPSLVLLAAVWATALAAVILARKPKNELAQVVKDAAHEAYQLGAKDKALELTELFHSQLLPANQLEVPGLYCSSKHFAGTETSGDYYQVFETARGPLVIVGDLPGDNLTATFNFARLHQQVSQVVERADSLVNIAEGLNDFVRQQYPGEVFTCVLARWEGANLHYLNAGHLPAVRISKRVASQLAVNSPAVGASAEAQFIEDVIEFPKGDLLLLYTDGSYTGLAERREQGAAEVLRLVNEFSGGEINTLCHRIFDCGQPEYSRSKDDSTVVVVRRQELVSDEKESTEKAAQPDAAPLAV